MSNFRGYRTAIAWLARESAGMTAEHLRQDKAVRLLAKVSGRPVAVVAEAVAIRSDARSRVLTALRSAEGRGEATINVVRKIAGIPSWCETRRTLDRLAAERAIEFVRKRRRSRITVREVQHDG